MNKQTKILLSLGVVAFLGYSFYKDYKTKKKNLTSYSLPVIEGKPINIV